jgi:Ricin-type beta-trefoil lectin domain
MRIVSREDRGSLPLAMLLTIVGIGVSGLLAAATTAQLGATRSAVQNTDALDVAQTGIQVALERIRMSVAADGSGDTTKLPCGPYTGTLAGGTGRTYTVAIYYLATQPPTGDVPWAQANKLPCPGPTYGTAATKPFYALLSSTGTVPAAASRTITATYRLQSQSREDFAGGLIHLYGPTNPDLCFAAPSTTPAAGTPLTMQVCDATNDAQRFAYTKNLALLLVATGVDGSTGMCLDAAPVHNTPVRFQPCSGAEQQQWSYTASRNFEAIDKRRRTDMCFHLTTPGTVGSTVVLYDSRSDPTACGAPYTTSRSFSPEFAVGSGNVVPSGQLATFGRFSTCVADDNDTDTLVELCDQVPVGGPPPTEADWYWIWNLPAPGTTGPIWVNSKYGNRDYCMTSPGTPALGAYVTLTRCPSPIPPSMTWKITGPTGIYSTTYRIESSYSAAAGTTYCLAVPDPTANPPDPNQALGTTRLTVAPCTGSTLQKWNAPTSILKSPLTDVSEN